MGHRVAVVWVVAAGVLGSGSARPPLSLPEEQPTRAAAVPVATKKRTLSGTLIMAASCSQSRPASSQPTRIGISISSGVSEPCSPMRVVS